MSALRGNDDGDAGIVPPSTGDSSPNPYDQYAGRWIALLGTQIIAQGGTPQQAFISAKASRFKETPHIIYVPTSTPLVFPPVLEQVRASLPAETPIYLVGGAVRDALLGRPTHDLDFVLPADSLKIARCVADKLAAAYYPLDEGRQYGRVVLSSETGERMVLDFTVYQGYTLESDLRARDFTINAMAVDVHQPQNLFDPLGGLSDLHAKILRDCSATALSDDPLRVLRGIRLATSFDLHILPDTRERMRKAARQLTHVSAERLRDELFRILNGPRLATALRALDMLGALQPILPELDALKGVEQSPPHIYDVWHHSLDVIQKLEELLAVLAPRYDEDKSANLFMGLVSMQLGRYREQIAGHLQTLLNAERPLRPLLFLAALYHDIGKPQTKGIDEKGRIRFLEHEGVGEKMIAKRARALHLSNPEIERAAGIVYFHMRPLLLSHENQPLTRRAIYRFFHAAGATGVDVCLLSLADLMGSCGPALSQQRWAKHLGVIRKLLEAWWERPTESISPPALLNGNDLMAELGLAPGPHIGRLLEAIREAQAAGELHTREAALSLARELRENFG